MCNIYMPPRDPPARAGFLAFLPVAPEAKILRAALGVLAALLLTGCEIEPQSTATPTDNPNFSVDRLFEHEGCTVYRFKDGGRSRYFSNCGRVEWSESCGKGCSREVEIDTAGPRE